MSIFYSQIQTFMTHLLPIGLDQVEFVDGKSKYNI